MKNKERISLPLGVGVVNEEMLKDKRLTKLKKNAIRVSLYLGGLPSSVLK